MIQHKREGTQLLEGKVLPYHVIYRETQMALKVANPFNANDSKIIACEPNVHDLSQLWFITKIRDDAKEITNAITGLVMEEEDSMIYLRRGRQKGSQLFYFVKIRNLMEHNENNYVIKTSKGSTQALCQYGALMVREFVNNQDHFIFEFVLAENSLPLVNSCTFRNDHSNKVIDVPESSFEVGKVLAQYDYHGKLNQRWVFIPSGSGQYKVKALNSNLFFDIEGNSISQGALIIQNRESDKPSQLWQIKKSKGGFTLHSIHANLYLGVLGDSRYNEAQLSLVPQHSNSCIWHILGKQPQ